MHGDEVALPQQFLLRPGPAHAHPGRPLRGEVAAPGHHLHVEGQPHPGDPGTDLPQPQQTQPAPRQIHAHRALPRPAAPKRRALLDQPPGQPEQQRPGQLHRRRRRTRRPAHGDPVGAGRRVVDHRVPHPRGHQQPQPGQPLEHLRRKGDPLPQRHHDVEIGDRRDEFRHRGRMLAERHDLDPVGHRGPVGDRGGDALEVVEYGAAESHGPHSSRSAPDQRARPFSGAGAPGRGHPRKPFGTPV